MTYKILNYIAEFLFLNSRSCKLTLKATYYVFIKIELKIPLNDES